MNNDTDIALLKARLASMEDELKEMSRRDQSRMRTAIVTLGGVVMAMAGYIWTHVGGGPRP
jgi:hypothetical protein